MRVNGAFLVLVAILSFAVWAEEPPAKTVPQVVLRIASIAPDASPWADTGQIFKKKSEAGSNGKLRMKLFLSGTLGSENDTVMATKRGQIQGFAGSTAALATQVPEFHVLELPYLFNTFEEAYFVLSKLRPDFEKYCSARGFVFGLWSENGFRSFGGKFKVTSPEDLKGKRLRSQENQSHQKMLRALGVIPVPLSSADALTALTNGFVEGYDQSLVFVLAASWQTASTHFSLTNHIYQAGAIVFNKETYDAMPSDVKDAITAAAVGLEDDIRQRLRAMNPILLKDLEATGVNVNVLTDAEKAPFAQIGAKARADYIKTATKGEQEVYAKILKVLAEYRARPAK